MKKPVATNLNQFITVLPILRLGWTGNRNRFPNWATATGGPVAIGCIQSSPRFFSGPYNWTFKH